MMPMIRTFRAEAALLRETLHHRTLQRGKMLTRAAMPVLLVGASVCASVSARAGEVDVIGGWIDALGDDRFRIHATLLHADTGWDHYADRWDVLSVDGDLLGGRELAHPHENEQPFTRSLTMTLPPGTREVILQGHDSVHGSGGTSLTVLVPEP